MENNKQGTFYIVSWEVPLQAAAMALSCTVCVSAAEDETIKLTVWGAEEDQDLLKELTDKFQEKYADQKFDIQIGVESESTAKDTILTDVEAGADVYAFADDQLTDLVKAGALLKLDDYAEALQLADTTLDDVKAANVEGAIDAASWDSLLEAADKAGKKVGMTLASGNLVACVSGTWDAITAQDVFGDGYAATKLPTFTVGDKQVQQGSVAGYKYVGVNGYSENSGWAVLLAEYFTNEESQQMFFDQRESGPSNKNVAASDSVQENVALAALSAQSEYAQAQKVGGKYWDSAQTFGELVAQGTLSADDDNAIQEALDNLVDGVTAPVE
ncbi:extracellular solute-binding protein [Blautia sp. HCP3S3_D9]|uniref:extracellular solute-binding protein n=1 Tax=Blautia sp. HCP3S3_D9 TaxID=3438912 RepID=UPI003F8BB654